MVEELIDQKRVEDSNQLLEDFNLKEDAEFFAEPANRLEFLSSLDFEDFLSVSQHVNARVRGFEPRDKATVKDKGAYLPLMKTPNEAEKPEALRKGFDTIKQYLHDSKDTDEQKVKSLGMAVEALIIWVHPFNDGNGRTSRFLGSFIENGTVDTEQLLKDAADRNERMRMYPEFLRVDDTTDLENDDFILDDDEIEVIKKAQEELPITEGIARSLKQLMDDKTLQVRVEAESERNKDVRAQWVERNTTAA